MEIGKTRIEGDKVYFDYYELKKPDKEDFYSGRVFCTLLWKARMKEYEASKRSVEVINGYLLVRDKLYLWFTGNQSGILIKKDQLCKAEVVGDKATIVKLYKIKP